MKIYLSLLSGRRDRREGVFKCIQRSNILPVKSLFSLTLSLRLACYSIDSVSTHRFWPQSGVKLFSDGISRLKLQSDAIW